MVIVNKFLDIFRSAVNPTYTGSVNLEINTMEYTRVKELIMERELYRHKEGFRDYEKKHY